MEEVYAEEEEQERREMLENVTDQLGLKHPICSGSYCLCDLTRDKKLESFSVVMRKKMLKFFEIPYGCRDRKKDLVTTKTFTTKIRFYWFSICSSDLVSRVGRPSQTLQKTEHS